MLVIMQAAAAPQVNWATFKAVATVLGSISAVIGITIFSSKVFRFINSLTDFITITAPKTVASISNMENTLNTAVFNHLDHIQTSSQATLSEIIRMREDFQAREVQAAREHGEIMGKLKSASAE